MDFFRTQTYFKDAKTTRHSGYSFPEISSSFKNVAESLIETDIRTTISAWFLSNVSRVYIIWKKETHSAFIVFLDKKQQK